MERNEEKLVLLLIDWLFHSFINTTPAFAIRMILAAPKLSCSNLFVLLCFIIRNVRKKNIELTFLRI